jgi:hypothetical protein
VRAGAGRHVGLTTAKVRVDWHRRVRVLVAVVNSLPRACGWLRVRFVVLRWQWGACFVMPGCSRRFVWGCLCECGARGLKKSWD